MQVLTQFAGISHQKYKNMIWIENEKRHTRFELSLQIFFAVKYQELHNKVLYLLKIQVLLESNISHGSSDKEQIHQNTNFILEGKVKSKKSIGA